MQREQLQGLAIGAGLVALIIAVATGRLPRWLRVSVDLGLVILAAGAGFYAYRYYNYPRTLTVAAGSIDGVAPQLMSAISARLTATGAVGVVGGGANQKLVEALTREYGLDGAKTHFKDLAVQDIAQAFKSKQINALLGAIKDYDQAIKLSPNNVMTISNRGATLT